MTYEHLNRLTPRDLETLRAILERSRPTSRGLPHLHEPRDCQVCDLIRAMDNYDKAYREGTR